MAKKRKLDAKPETASLPEPDSVDEKTAIDEPETTLTSEAPIEGSPVPESGQSIKEEPISEEEFKAQALETSDIVPDTSGSAKPPPTDVVACGDDNEDGSDPAFLEKILAPFAKEQLISLLRDGALKHPDLLDSILQSADVDPAHRKVFVHGLGWNTTAETLTDIFGQYGDIEDCNAVVDKVTGKSKGYGFILFKDRSGARRALEEPQKKIGNRMAACQLASIGPVPAPPPVLPVSEYTQRKIYVSNVGADLDLQKLLQLFSKFGEIEEGPLGLDKTTGKPKGFCLFVYKSAESAKKALEEPHKNFEGHILHCQKAVDGPKYNKQGANLPQGGGHHAGFHHGSTGFGARGPKIGRNGGAVFMGGMSSSVGGPAHLIVPPVASIGFNQAGQTVNNGVHALKSTFGNQVGGAGGYTKTSVIGGYGASQIHGHYGGSVMGQGGTWTQ
ncbi:hypothetical protein KFK09_021446 [Dendrobium nobile]|uniref:RRM domain-containing protein n=1 Tax=Dendrobium nobile TaxID=94219 RepID=A0A8T3AVV4_DENNO|nr:hypothetical protein KFK09_021446 [Dendrobium nobile]